MSIPSSIVKSKILLIFYNSFNAETKFKFPVNCFYNLFCFSDDNCDAIPYKNVSKFKNRDRKIFIFTNFYLFCYKTFIFHEKCTAFPSQNHLTILQFTVKQTCEEIFIYSVTMAFLDVDIPIENYSKNY